MSLPTSYSLHETLARRSLMIRPMSFSCSSRPRPRSCSCRTAASKPKNDYWHSLNLRSDIIVKGQNHSGESGSDAFLDAVQPRLIIATSRDFPSYERVSDTWMENLQKRGIKLFRQDETGAVILRFRQNSWEAQSYFTGEIFRSSSQ